MANPKKNVTSNLISKLGGNAFWLDCSHFKEIT